MNAIMDLFSLNGKNAVVTGANTGLGQGICVALAAAGAHVFGVARRSCDETGIFLFLRRCPDKKFVFSLRHSKTHIHLLPAVGARLWNCGDCQ